MQEELLEPDPDADLSVYVVWEPTLGGRRANAVEATGLMPDPRVRHFWNPDFLAGDRFRELGVGGHAWDIYFLYGPQATWSAPLPEPLISHGFTVYGRRDALQNALASLMEGAQP